jgi:integrase
MTDKEDTDKRAPEPRALTDTFVKGFKNTSEQRLEIRDTVVTGLVLRVTVRGAKSFSVQTRGADNRKVRIKVGNYPLVSVKEAREIARSHLAAISRGEDPRELERLARARIESEMLTLETLLDEAEVAFAPTTAMWRRDYRFGRIKAEARASIENVFSPLLKRPLTKASLADFSRAVKGYKPKKPKAGKKTANGAASRALAYLRTVLDWASGRGRFAKEGAARDPRLELPDLAKIHDPSIDDTTLEFKRERVLGQGELVAVMPLLVYPAPKDLRHSLDPKDDYGPIAFKFLFLTLSRTEEVEAARCGDFDRDARTWTKSVKTRRKPGTRGSAERRVVTVPLSDEAFALLLSLPSFVDGRPDDFVFPSSKGGRLCNWDRTQEAIHGASETCGWHRHDLRRTAATILQQLGVAPAVIDTLLCHLNPLGAENVSGAAVNYMIDKQILENVIDQKRLAVNLLSAAVASICGDLNETPTRVVEQPNWTVQAGARKPSPWSVLA